MSRKLQIVILTVVGILVVLVIMKMPLASKAMTTMLPGLLATEEPIDPYIDEIKWFQDELQSTDLSDEARNLIEAKLNMVSIEATQRVEGITRAPTRPVSMPETPANQVFGMKLPDGIDDHPSAPFSESVVTVLNSWRKTTDDRYYLVYAGFLTQDTQQGAILVFHPSVHHFQQYNTPDNSGGVRVVEEKGTTIILQSTQGILFYFDVAKEQYVDSNGTPIPTNTTMPPTPTQIINSYPYPIPPYP
jgi:hypothetical protein